MGVSLIDEIEVSKSGDNRFIHGLGDYLLRRRNETAARDRGGYISPSQVGGCPQWALNQLRKRPQDNTKDPWSIPFLESATRLHEQFQVYGLGAGLLDPESIEEWVEYKPFKIGGSIDGCFIGDDAPLFEIKTLSTHLFSKVCATNEVLDKHKLQNHCYMLAKGRRQTVFLYISRDDPSNLKEILYEWDDKFISN